MNYGRPAAVAGRRQRRPARIPEGQCAHQACGAHQLAGAHTATSCSGPLLGVGANTLFDGGHGGEPPSKSIPSEISAGKAWPTASRL